MDSHHVVVPWPYRQLTLRRHTVIKLAVISICLLLVIQTALGAAKLALESDDRPAELRRRVTSKGGTTEAAITRLNEGGLVELFNEALQAAAKRSEELAKLS